jgi:hypothetical protein
VATLKAVILFTNQRSWLLKLYGRFFSGSDRTGLSSGISFFASATSSNKFNMVIYHQPLLDQMVASLRYFEPEVVWSDDAFADSCGL